MKFIICEKNIAARRIAFILSNGKAKQKKIGKTSIYEYTKDNETWITIGLKGHIVTLDFPPGFNHWKHTALRDLIYVQPHKKIREKEIAFTLKQLAAQAPDIIVATDYDREGELIGVESLELLNQYNPKISNIKRARFSALTYQDVTQAFHNPVTVNYNLSNAAETRQIIDLVWGATLTRFVSLTAHQLGKDFLSIGRVQTPTLALLVERERDIKLFVPQLFWQIVATLTKDQSFSAYHVDDKFWDESKAKAIFDKVKSCKQGVVTRVKNTVMQESPPSPFNTTLFLQEASSLGFSASKAMQLAEELYMHGLISYPRTDNTVYPKTLGLKTIVEKLLNSRFSEAAQEVLTHGRKTPTRGKKFSSDHPPIHPVNIPTKTKLTSDQDKIYELVCRRFLATLAQNAVTESMEVSLDIGGEVFNAKGYRVIEAHWKAIYTYKRDKRKPLPDLAKGEQVMVSKINLKQDKTRPPSRYTQGMLIAKMEALMLGTKSTRHEIISKLYSRKYVTGSPPIPTATAFAVVDAIREYSVAKPEMTAQLEEDMDNIATGKKTREDTVTKSRDMLSQVVQSLEKNKDAIRVSIRDALKEQKTVGVCPECGQDMVIRSSKQGKRFVGCSNYPSCKNTYSLPQKGYLLKTDIKCGKCDAPVIKVKMKGKKYWDMCLNSTCPGKKKYASDK